MFEFCSLFSDFPEYTCLNHFLMKDRINNNLTKRKMNNCNSMPFGAAWAYYGSVLVLASAAL